MNKSFTLPVQIKAVGDDGTFSGYAATFGNIDKGDDIIVKGAFAEYLASIGTNYPSVCWQHETDEPIGVTTLMREDEIGLYVEGNLILEVQQAAEARVLAKAGAVKGLSIGYWVNEREYNNEGIRILKKLSLYEYSFVTCPMNEMAKFSNVKAAELGSIKECEIYLRDVCGLSRSESKTLIAKIKGVRDAEPDISELIQSLKNFQQTLSG